MIPIVQRLFVDAVDLPLLRGHGNVAIRQKDALSLWVEVQAPFEVPVHEPFFLRVVLPQLVALHPVTREQSHRRFVPSSGDVQALLNAPRSQIFPPGHLEVLIGVDFVLGARTGHDPVVLRLGLGVETQFRSGQVLDLAGGEVVGLDGGVDLDQVEGDVGHEPLEGLALELLPQGSLLGEVAGVDGAVVGSSQVDVLGVLVHPDFGDALVVLAEEVAAAGVGEAGELPVDVADPGAGGVVHFAAALPDFEGELVLLAAPDVEARVVPGNFSLKIVCH